MARSTASALAGRARIDDEHAFIASLHRNVGARADDHPHLPLDLDGLHAADATGGWAGVGDCANAVTVAMANAAATGNARVISSACP